MEIYWPMKSRVRTSVSAQSVFPACAATICFSRLIGLLGARKGAGLTGWGAQASRGVWVWASAPVQLSHRPAADNKRKLFAAFIFVPFRKFASRLQYTR